MKFLRTYDTLGRQLAINVDSIVSVYPQLSRTTITTRDAAVYFVVNEPYDDILAKLAAL